MIQEGDIVNCIEQYENGIIRTYWVIHIYKADYAIYTTVLLLDVEYIEDDIISKEIFENCNINLMRELSYIDYLDRYELNVLYTRKMKLKKLLNA